METTSGVRSGALTGTAEFSEKVDSKGNQQRRHGCSLVKRKKGQGRCQEDNDSGLY